MGALFIGEYYHCQTANYGKRDCASPCMKCRDHRNKVARVLAAKLMRICLAALRSGELYTERVMYREKKIGLTPPYEGITTGSGRLKARSDSSLA